MDLIQLITVEEIKNYSPVSKNIDANLIEPFIPLAQTLHLRPTLGDSLYNELLDAISGDTLSGDSYTLVNTYCTPMLVWYALYEALPFIWTRMNAKGLTKGYSDTTQALDKKEYELLKQEMLDKGVSFKNLMIDYLNDNATLFPSYRTEGNSTKYNSSGIFLGKDYSC